MKQKVLFPRNNALMFFIFFVCTITIFSCYQNKIDQYVITKQLFQSYTENKNSFDSLKMALGDTSISEIEIKQFAKNLVLKNNFGFGKLILSTTISTKEEKAFNVKELDYGVSCGYLYIMNPIQDSFTNPRLVYKKIDGNWYSYLFFN